jgi:hypothetical protein
LAHPPAPIVQSNLTTNLYGEVGIRYAFVALNNYEGALRLPGEFGRGTSERKGDRESYEAIMLEARIQMNDSRLIHALLRTCFDWTEKVYSTPKSQRSGIRGRCPLSKMPEESNRLN